MAGPTTRQLLDSETWYGCRGQHAGALRILLASPSPYPVAAASLGLHQVYRLMASHPGVQVDRAWLRGPGTRVRGVETGRSARDFHVIAFSMSYELEIEGLVHMLRGCGLEPLARDRGPGDPLVILGGPITYAGWGFVTPFVDLVLPGEGEGPVPRLLELLDRCDGDKERVIEEVGEAPWERAGMEALPASSCWTSPDSTFSDMFMVEAVRGCNQSCAYCVMRRKSSGGMRIVPAREILATIPAGVSKVGLVGAGVSDHPDIVDLVRAITGRGASVGLSSLRAERLDEDLVELLVEGGMRTLTTALDGVSERVRRSLKRSTRARHVLEAAQVARRLGLKRLKLYLMIGVPGEEDRDIDEGVDLIRELTRIIPLTLTVSPFVPKPRTPLAGAGFMGIPEIKRRVSRLRRGLKGRARISSVSPRAAWLEYRLATGGPEVGEAALRALELGGGPGAWARVLPRDPAPRSPEPGPGARRGAGEGGADGASGLGHPGSL